MPTMVRQKSKPKTICVIAMHIPALKIQITLKSGDRQELALEFGTTSLPKGAKWAMANLKH